MAALHRNIKGPNSDLWYVKRGSPENDGPNEQRYGYVPGNREAVGSLLAERRNATVP